jgi:hypothetical protein
MYGPEETTPMHDLTRYNKLWTVLSGTVVQAVAAGLIVGQTAAWLTIVIGAVVSAGVFSVPNSES